MARKQIIDLGWAYGKAFQYSQAVRAGDLLFLAGQCPVDAQGNTVAAGDVRGQTRQVFENLKAVLAAAGLTLDDVVEIVTYHVDMADLPAMAEVKSEYLTRDFPAWTAVGVTALAFPGQLVELKATALAG
jgi:reactive intermediate/imine deaminase